MRKKVAITAAIVLLAIIVYILSQYRGIKPEETLRSYFRCVGSQSYEEMYGMISESSQQGISKEDFISRNKNIYQGINAHNLKIEIKEVKKLSLHETKITYDTSMDTSAGAIEFSNTAKLVKKDKRHYAIEWASSLIFPDLQDDYKVRVKTDKAERGTLLDRNGNAIAGQGEVSCVGIVPGKLGDNRDESIEKIATLLGETAASINSELSSSWVKDDSFVPIREVSKDSAELKEQLLQIPGVKITTVEERVYPYKEAASLLTGYVQGITKEELEQNSSKGYSSTSVIGKSGIEKQFEDRLKGSNGSEIYIIDSSGQKVKTLAQTERKDGEDIKLTIDINMQVQLYEQLKNDEGFFVVMQPKTGEILALVSTPSYDANDFVLGMSAEKWEELKSDESKPMYIRFLQSWCPGSTFKPLTGAIGLDSGKLTEDDEFAYTGLAWQKDSSWGSHMITTLTAYSGSKNLKNALIHSDNIYFAQAALKIGKEALASGLDKLMFNKSLDILPNMAKSQYSNSGSIGTEGLLADSGFGQGEILVNPIHMASVYSAFVNSGSMVKPYIEYKESKEAEYLVEGAFSKEAADIIKNDMIQVIEDKGGTAHDMKVDGVTIAGKTGTAEITDSQDGKSETLGWFDCFTADDSSENQLLVISMVENANENGGSHYLISKLKALFK